MAGGLSIYLLPLYKQKRRKIENETDNRVEEHREYNTSDTSSILR